VVASRDIAAGEEVYVDYGKWYWAGSKILPSRLRARPPPSSTGAGPGDPGAPSQ